MTRDECRLPGCDAEPGSGDGNPVAYSTRRFCSQECAVKYDHLKADADDAQRAEATERHHDDAPRHDRGGRGL